MSKVRKEPKWVITDGVLIMEEQEEQEEQEEVLECDSCADAIDMDDGDYFHDERNGEIYCSSCGTICDDCSEIYRRNTRDRFVTVCHKCEDSWWYCDRCSSATHEDYVRNVESVYTGGHETWCESCTEDNAEYCERHDQYEQEACNNRYGGLIHNYDYNPDNGWRYNGALKLNHKELSQITFFGVELEIESSDSDLEEGAEAVLTHFNGGEDMQSDKVVYLKEDGSIDNGFEIVTQPMTFDFAMSLDWSILKKLKDMGYRSWSGGACGLHVHVSRTAFKDRQHLWKFTQLINGNPTSCALLAGRTSERWSKYDKKLSSKTVLGKEFPERYSAVNLLNPRTVEVRIFRGSLRPERVPMAIQFVESCIEYTKDLPLNQIAKDGLAWFKYQAFLMSDEEKYKELLTIMKERVV